MRREYLVIVAQSPLRLAAATVARRLATVLQARSLHGPSASGYGRDQSLSGQVYRDISRLRPNLRSPERAPSYSTLPYLGGVACLFVCCAASRRWDLRQRPHFDRVRLARRPVAMHDYSQPSDRKTE